MNNQVIEVLSKEHGQEVKKYWQDKGFDTSDYGFDRNKEDGDECRYYGVLDHAFVFCDLDVVKNYRAEIIELPKTTEELPIPRDVLVRDSESYKWAKRELIADLSKYVFEMPFVCRGKNGKAAVRWEYMKELPTEITKDEAEKMLSELKGVEIKIK